MASSTLSGVSEPTTRRAMASSLNPSPPMTALPMGAPPATQCAMPMSMASLAIAMGMSTADWAPARVPHVPVPTVSLSVASSSAGGVPPSRKTARAYMPDSSTFPSAVTARTLSTADAKAVILSATALTRRAPTAASICASRAVCKR